MAASISRYATRRETVRSNWFGAEDLVLWGQGLTPGTPRLRIHFLRILLPSIRPRINKGTLRSTKREQVGTD